jgi:hypothetical protein
MRRGLVLVAIALSGLAATAAAPERAWACTCAPADPAVILAEARAAFVGVYLDRRLPESGSGDLAVYRFRVERAVKGTLPPTIEVESAVDAATCGLAVSSGERVGLALRRSGGAWRSDLCAQVEADALLAAAPPGEGQIAIGEDVVGSYAPASLLAFAALLAAGVGLFLIRRRFRPD